MLLAVGSVMVFADGINDPKLIISKVQSGGNSCPPQGCTGVGSTFTFQTPANGSGTLFFTNESGENWTSLELIEKGEPAADISCAAYVFASCTVTTLKNGSVEILMSESKGGALWSNTGVPNGGSFSLTFKCVGSSCWPGNLKFGAGADGSNPPSVVPEPATISLMVMGMGALVSRRKMWKNRWNA